MARLVVLADWVVALEHTRPLVLVTQWEAVVEPVRQVGCRLLWAVQLAVH